MIRKQLITALALFVGVAIGYLIDSQGKKPQSVEAGAVRVAQTKGVPDRGAEGTIRGLRARIAELERALAAKTEAQLSAVSNALSKIERPEGPGKPGSFDPFSWLRKNDPAKFSQITNRMEQFRQRRQARQEMKREFLSSIDTSRMSASARKTHEQLQSVLAKRAELEEALHDPNLTDDQRMELMKQMHEASQSMRSLNQKERTNLLGETVKTLGLTGDDAKEVVDTILDVVESTDGGGHGAPPGPPPAGGMPPGGGPGPR